MADSPAETEETPKKQEGVSDRKQFWIDYYLDLAKDLEDKKITKEQFARQAGELTAGLEGQAERDPLTGILSRGHMAGEIEREAKESERTRLPLILVFADLDNFKAVNDEYGHQVGDDVLKGFVRIVQGKTEPLGGSVGRWGGEEFMFIFPDTSEEEAIKLIGEMGQAVWLATGHESNIPQLQTMSCGVSLRKSYETIDEWIARVDKLNYEAKKGGRNQMVMERADESREIVKFNEV